MIFADRREAGRTLASKLKEYPDRPDLLVLALPRGGVPVAYEVAKALQAPLDVFLEEPLRPEPIKPRLLGHWGTGAGFNLI